MATDELAARAIAAGHRGRESLPRRGALRERRPLADLARRVRSAGLSVMIYSGFTREEARSEARARDPSSTRATCWSMAATSAISPSLAAGGSGRRTSSFTSLSERYRSSDPRFTMPNTVGSVSRKGELVVNGWPHPCGAAPAAGAEVSREVDLLTIARAIVSAGAERRGRRLAGDRCEGEAPSARARWRSRTRSRAPFTCWRGSEADVRGRAAGRRGPETRRPMRPVRSSRSVRYVRAPRWLRGPLGQFAVKPFDTIPGTRSATSSSRIS